MEIIEKIEPIFKGMDIKGYKVKMLSNNNEKTQFFRSDDKELMKKLQKYHEELIRKKIDFNEQLINHNNTSKYIFFINGGVSLVLLMFLIIFSGKIDFSIIRTICMSALGITFGSSLYLAPKLNANDKKNMMDKIQQLDLDFEECIDMIMSVTQAIGTTKENTKENVQQNSEINQKEKVSGQKTRKFQTDRPSFVKNLDIRSIDIELLREASRIDSISHNPIKIKVSANNIGNYKKSDERDKNNSRRYQDKKTQISFDGNSEEVMGEEYSSRRR